MTFARWYGSIGLARSTQQWRWFGYWLSLQLFWVKFCILDLRLGNAMVGFGGFRESGVIYAFCWLARGFWYDVCFCNHRCRRAPLDDTVNIRQMQHCIVRFSLRSLWIYLVWNSRRRSGSLRRMCHPKKKIHTINDWVSQFVGFGDFQIPMKQSFWEGDHRMIQSHLSPATFFRSVLLNA